MLTRRITAGSDLVGTVALTQEIPHPFISLVPLITAPTSKRGKCIVVTELRLQNGHTGTEGVDPALGVFFFDGLEEFTLMHMCVLKTSSCGHGR